MSANQSKLLQFKCHIIFSGNISYFKTWDMKKQKSQSMSNMNLIKNKHIYQ